MMFTYVSNFSSFKRDSLLILAIISGILGVSFSSIHLAQFPHGMIIMPWNFPIIVLVLVIISGIFLGLSIYRKPSYFLPVLLMTNLVTSGIYVLRFPIYDEYLTFCLTIAALLAVLEKRVRLRPKYQIPQQWKIVFLLLMAHLLIMSLVGAAWTGNLKALRFSVIYAEVFICVWLLVKFNFPILERQKLVKMILSFTLYYYIAVLLHQLLTFYMGYHQAVLEAIGYGGTSYLTLIGVISAPVSMLCIKEKRYMRRSFIVLFLILLIAILADSRAGMLPLLITFVMIPFVFNFIRLIKIIGISIVVVMIAGILTVGRVNWIMDMGDAISRSFNIGGTMTYNYYGRTVTASSGDTGRYLYVAAASQALISNPLLFTFGGGSYSFFPIIQPFYEELSEESGSSIDIVNYGSSLGGIKEPPRPPAMGSLIIETGMIGILLTGILLIKNFYYVVFRRSNLTGKLMISRTGILLGVIPIMLPLWSFFGEFQDAIIIYLILAPFGFINLLGREPTEN